MENQSKIFEDAFNLLCGTSLGEGIHRKVFECHLDPSLVVKVETSGDHRTFANFREMDVWNNLEHTKLSKWLAPCVSLSMSGLILLQKRVKPIRREEMPKKLPGFLTDLKVENFGILDGQVVCVDYALTLHNYEKKMRNTKHLM